MKEHRTLKEAVEKYEEICERLDQLNEEAFTLEQEIAYLKTKEK